MPNKANDLTGLVSGKLTVLEKTENRIHKCVVWKCVCECGNIKYVQSTLLTSGLVKSCGCLPKEHMARLGKQHGSTNGKRYSGKEVGLAARNEVYRNYKQHAVRRKLEFNLTVEEFENITSSNCFYCGCKPSQFGGKHAKVYNGVYVYNGIDRVDSSKGYFIGNVVPACGTCNRAKMAMGYVEFLDWVRKVYTYRIDNNGENNTEG